MGTGLARRGNWFTPVLLWPVILPLLAPLLTWLRPNGEVRTLSRSSSDVLEAAFSTSGELRGRYSNDTELKDVVEETADTNKRAVVRRDGVRYSQLTVKTRSCNAGLERNGYLVRYPVCTLGGLLLATAGLFSSPHQYASRAMRLLPKGGKA
ncbi:hypothetical protein GGR56DRAFT_645655 [Xylariaceae sp. FL0804]|nr:hypothetical protein GGR56DRAFT_645655 [Xylariaceae sp. FL0804]